MPSSELLERLLEYRGVGKEESQDFLSPSYGKLHDPLLLTDMEKARDRVIEGIKNDEKIMVFSDYDADGIPGAVVLSDFFKRVGYKNVSFYIPHRHDEGFGLSMGAIDEAEKRGTSLIITVDCGVADIEEVLYAQNKKIDVIITDHHREKERLPKAYAVVNPARQDSLYPFPHLCGAAVAYKLVQAVLGKERFGIKDGMEKWSLDMVAIATLSDLVPLLGENRILAKFGLEVLRKSPRPGLQTLFQKLKINQRFVNEDDIAFMITPRINAASRMGEPEDAFRLLATTDFREAEVLATHLENINNERKILVANIVKDAKKHLKERTDLNNVIVIGNPDWRPAILGLVANSLVEEYGRPVFVWGRDGDGMLKGSCRTSKGHDLHELMSKAKDEFLQFGGHPGAGGFEVELSKLPTLEEKLSDVLENFEAKKLDQELVIDIEEGEINESLWRLLSTLAPFGVGNPKPIFRLKTVVKSVRQFGKENNHLELSLGGGIKAISFFSNKETYDLSAVPSIYSVAANLEKSFFRGRPDLRLRIVEISN